MMMFGSLLTTILAFIFVLTIVVVIHELGHYLVARFFGVQVTAFSIGFGPELYHRFDRNGTRWRIAAIPMGGYVKWVDDENGASMPDRDAIANMTPEQRAGSFHAKPVWQRAAIVAAGPFANFLLAIALYGCIFWLIGERSTVPRVDKVVAASAAEAGGFQAGDVIRNVNGAPIASFDDLRRITAMSAGTELRFEVERGTSKILLVATPRLAEVSDNLGGKMRIGQLGLSGSALPSDVQQKSYSVFEALGRGVLECTRVAGETVRYLGRVLTARESGDQIGGPGLIAAASGKMASLGWIPLFMFVAFISVSVGLANLFPIPILDGGHLVMYAIEAVRGHPLAEKTQEYAFRFGFAVLLCLFVFAIKNDLTRLFS
jgi:regulator of sigma E protease